MMDRLDEAGILFWSETLGPAVSLANTQDWDYFMKYQLIQMQEMLGTHASIHGRGRPMWPFFAVTPLCCDHPLL